jgi:hypothetical protein
VERYYDMEMVEHNAVMQLLAMLTVKFERCFQDSWNKYLCAEGAYMDGDESSLPISSVIESVFIPVIRLHT